MVLFRHSAAPCMISDRKRMGFGCSVLSHRRERRLKLVLINSGIKPTEEISAERDEEGRIRYKDTRHGQHFRNGSFVALKWKFISISPNLGAQCVQLDQSDCLL